MSWAASSKGSAWGPAPRHGRLVDSAQLPALIAAGAVLAAGMLASPFLTLGPFSHHMALHIAAMNVAAPLCAALWLGSPTRQTGKALWAATVSQMALLWAWHVPALHASASQSPLLQVVLHAGLFGSALLFWRAVLSPTASRWQAILALLLTGKVACLLGALLVFSPRVLYAMPARAHAGHGALPVGLSDLADQQLGGLLMLAACPLSYVLAGVVLAAQLVGGLQRGAAPLANAR